MTNQALREHLIRTGDLCGDGGDRGLLEAVLLPSRRPGFEVILVNARHVKNLLAARPMSRCDLVGPARRPRLVRGSFVPPPRSGCSVI